jgi:hypothetical protein
MTGDINVGGGATGNFNTGDNARQGNVTVTGSEAAVLKDDLLADLAKLRTEIEALGRPDVLTRVDDLTEEATAPDVDKKGGRKAFDRLKAALSGVVAVTTLLAGIEDQVRKLFS